MPREFKRLHEILTPCLHHGDIIFFDDCEGTFRWKDTGTGTFLVDFQVLQSYTGTNGLRIQTDETELAGAYAQAQRGIPTLPIPKIEFSAHFSHLNAIPDAYFDFIIEYGDGTNYHRAGIRHIANTGQVQYMDSVGVFQDIPGMICKLQNDNWQEIKLELDFNSTPKVYGKLSFACQEVDLSAYAIRTVDVTVYKYLNIALKATSNLDTTTVRLNIDNVMVKLI